MRVDKFFSYICFFLQYKKDWFYSLAPKVFFLLFWKKNVFDIQSNDKVVGWFHCDKHKFIWQGGGGPNLGFICERDYDVRELVTL